MAIPSAFSISSLPFPITSLTIHKPSSSSSSLTLYNKRLPHFQNPGFCSVKPLQRSRTLCKFSRSIFPFESHVSDENEDCDEEYEDDDDEEAAEEYEYVSDEASGGGEDDEGEGESDYSIGAAEEGKLRFEEFKWQRFERIRKDVREFGEEILDVHELASVFSFRIDKFQRLAIQAFLRGSSVVVSAPTSSGKTLIAEAAAVATAARGRRLFYTTPLKALSNQKFREFRETFGDRNVGLLTGDSSINKEAQILIMTTEILRNMLYKSVGMASSDSGLLHVDVIVLDEVHYLSDISRGTVWEEIVIYCPKDVQLICLSATVGNPDELAGWIGQIHGRTELVTSHKRPVPLTWHFSTKGALLPLLNEKGKSINRSLPLNNRQLDESGAILRKDGWYRRKSRRHESDLNLLSKNEKTALRRSQVPQVVDTLWQLKERGILPAVWFIFSRKGCDAAVQYLENCMLLDECEACEVDLALKRFRAQYPDAVRESSVKGLRKGLAVHHAGCLPLWKSFIEELFQRGLVKVVFATETLAAGINMPARTAVISSLNKRADSGRVSLSSNELFQMAGRAGRRGIDEMGHVILVQSAYEGPEECCKLLSSGLEPLTSQFTASYGMVLNLLAGAKVTRGSTESDELKISRGRTLEEASKLIEQSFGNYVGSNVMSASKEELYRIEKEIEMLSSEISDEAIDRKSQKLLSASAHQEISNLQEDLRAEKRLRTELRRRMEVERMLSLKPLLRDLQDGHLPFVCLQYNDVDGVQHVVATVYLGSIDLLTAPKLKNMVNCADLSALNIEAESNDIGGVDGEDNLKPCYHVALGSDNSWYLFTEKWIKTVYRTGLTNVALAKGDALPRQIMTELVEKGAMQWQKLEESEFGGLWCMEGSLETWSWSLNVPVLSTLSGDDEALKFSQAYDETVECYKDQRNKVARLKKRISRLDGFKEYRKIIDMARFTEEKIRRLKVRSNRLTKRIEQIEPTGWKEFLEVSNVIHESRALDINTLVVFPLGETASAIRGENELWLAMVLRNNLLVSLKPAQLAAVCGSLVSEGIKLRPSKSSSYIYEPSAVVLDVVKLLEEQRISLLELQEKHGVNIPCCLDSQFAGMVEAWASGLTWREMMMDCAMDEGDLARLLRRTIDLLVQVPKLPDIDPLLQSNAKSASNVMDRPPISELAG
ncbi:hypothetical protein DM860_006897 [Cuscuta australis]|uniref:Helicase ATP-binding domain-containing protein n=1 Tax=Cuscuta australis TaxID=267555 RepID=A0A328E5E4_9ASTE|nr:hypothetical protein DM860_006897 [Cuscuta australis]